MKGKMTKPEHKGPMPPKTHPMPGAGPMHGEHHPTGKPAPKKVVAKKRR